MADDPRATASHDGGRVNMGVLLVGVLLCVLGVVIAVGANGRWIALGLPMALVGMALALIEVTEMRDDT